MALFAPVSSPAACALVGNSLMSSLVDDFERAQLRETVPEFSVGDTVRVHVTVREGDNERVQVFEGTVIRRRSGSVNENFTVRRVTHDVGVERTFFLHSPIVRDIEVTRRGKVRRARLYYLRDRVGRAARVKERRD